MEIYQADYESLKNDLMDLRELLVRTKTKAEKNHCLSSIYTLNLLCDALNHDGFDYLHELIKKNKSKYFDSFSFSNKHRDLYAHNFVINKKVIREILYNYIGIYEEEIKKYDFATDYTDIMFSKKDAKLILYDFFERYHKEELDYIDSLINKKRILSVGSAYLYDGLCFNLYKKDPVIVVKGSGYSMQSLITLIHELAHTIDYRKISEMYSVNIMEKYHYCSNYVEFLSRLYEKQALEYFYDFHFDDNSVISMIADFHFSTYFNLVKTYILSLLPDSIIERSNYLKYDKEQIKLLISTEDYDSSFDKYLDSGNFDLKESGSYWFSGILSTVCDSKIKDNSSDAKNLYENIMANRFGLFKPDIFKDLNLTDDDIEKCLRKEINFLSK